MLMMCNVMTLAHLRRIHDLAVSTAPYAEIPLEALLIALSAAYLGTLHAVMGSWAALKGSFRDTAAAAWSTAATSSEVCLGVHTKSCAPATLILRQ